MSILKYYSFVGTVQQGFQTRIGQGGRTVKIGNRNKNRFFKHKEPNFLLIPWTPRIGVGLHKLVARTVRSNPLAIFFFFKKKQLNTILFYLIKLFISYKELKKIIIKIFQRYSTLLQKLIINFNVFMIIILFY